MSCAKYLVEVGLLDQTDCERLTRLFHRLSPETRYRRFLSPVVRTDQVQPKRLLDIEHYDREAVTATHIHEIIGVARYARSAPSDCAEIAIVVEDAWHRRGVGTMMMRRLQRSARAAGVTKFTGLMHADNRPVIAFLRHQFPAATFRLESGLLEVEIPLLDG